MCYETGPGDMWKYSEQQLCGGGGGAASGRLSEGGGGLSAACQGASAKPVAGPNPPPALAHSVSQPGPASRRVASPPQLPEAATPGPKGALA